MNHAMSFPVYNKVVRSSYDDFGIVADTISTHERKMNAEQVINRFFVGHADIPELEREAVMRSVSAGPGFARQFREAEEIAEGGFGAALNPPSKMVEEALFNYSLTELGAVVLKRLLLWDDEFIAKGWRDVGGALTESGIRAYGEGQWRPLRIASNGHDSDTVTPSGALVLPDYFVEENYTTGDVSNPLAILHHELKAHVLPLKEAAGLSPGREMELICVRLESEMLCELGRPARRLNWGRDDGTLDHTLHEASEQYFYGLVRYDENESLVQIDPETEELIGPARVKETTIAQDKIKRTT